MPPLRAVWLAAEANFQGSPPEDRCGHVAASIKNHAAWGDEFIIIHGGINKEREALDSLAVLALDQHSWSAPAPLSSPGPSPRAFHSCAVLGRRLYIYGGHVYLKREARLHCFDDLWALDTDTWEWSPLGPGKPGRPRPPARDRAAMAPSPDGQSLLLFGGADASNRRLEDLWRYDLRSGEWAEVADGGGGPRPRPRCSATLCTLSARALLYGGDNYGVSGELWSLKVTGGGQQGEGEGEAGSPQSSWTPLSLDGPAPAPRRGHAAAPYGAGILVSGGFTEQRSLIGIKSRGGYLDDVVVLDRLGESLAWQVATPGTNDHGPCAREKHSLTLVSDGRMFLFGGTDGKTTLGDAWWLQGLTSAFTSLRDRLGLPLGPPPAQDMLPVGVLAGEYDSGLLVLGRRVLGEAREADGDRGRAAQAARSFLATCTPAELRLGDVGALVADYRRLARAGFAAALRASAAAGPGGKQGGEMPMPGRFMHLRPEDLRMHEVASILDEYRLLLTTQFG